MGYERNDRYYASGRDYSGDSGRGDYGRDAYRRDAGDPRDRGFFDRAGDEVRSWFGDEEAERRRRQDERYDERYDNRGRYEDGGRFARDDRGGYRSPDAYPNWARSNRDEGYARGYRYARSGEPGQFGTDGTGGSFADTGYAYGGDAARPRTDYRAYYQDRGNRATNDDQHGYRSWRDRQIDEFDRDYDEYRREHHQRFASEFATWRQARQGQRESLVQAKEHQEVVGSDGVHVGKVDHIRGDRILLTKTDRDAGGHHHSIPSSWIAKVDDKVHLSKTAAEAQQVWRDEDRNGGLFGSSNGRDDADRGATNLNRSFSGTY